MTARTEGPGKQPRTTRIVRLREHWARPVPVNREVLVAQPIDSRVPGGLGEGSATGARNRPPVLLVPGFGHGAWAFAEHWLDHLAERGFPAHAMSLRGHGASGAAPKTDLRAYVHDVTQVAASLPRQAVLLGHGAGAAVVALALARYPARAGVLVSPLLPGFGAALTLLADNPVGTLLGAVGGGVRLSRRQLFSGELAADQAEEYLSRLTELPLRVRWRYLRQLRLERPVGDPPVLVLGSPDDRMVSRTALERAARRFGGSPLLFPGMGHDLMLDARWSEPAEAICDWLAQLD